MPLKNYSELGFNIFLESSNSLLSGFRDLQLYSTVEFDKETGEIPTSEVSKGLATIDTEKLSDALIKQLLGKIRVTALTSGDISQPINVVSGHIQSANFVSGTGGSGWRIDGDGNLEASTGTFRGNVTGATITGGTFRTSASGERIQLITTNLLEAYDDDENLVFRLSPLGSEASLTTAQFSDATGLLGELFATRTGGPASNTQRIALQSTAATVPYSAHLAIESGVVPSTDPQIEIKGNFIPDTTDVYYLGTSSLKFKQGFISDTPTDDNHIAIKSYVDNQIEDWIVASDTLQLSDDTEDAWNPVSYTKYAELVSTGNGTLRVKWDMKRTAGSGTGYAKIYKNGVAVGTENSTTSATYETKTETSVNVDINDLVQLYCYSSDGNASAFKSQNFRLYWDASTIKPYIDAHEPRVYFEHISGSNAFGAGTDTFDVEVNVGFAPKMIQLIGRLSNVTPSTAPATFLTATVYDSIGATAVQIVPMAVWYNNTYNGLNLTLANERPSRITNGLYYFTTAAAENCLLTVQSITSTITTLRFTKTGDDADTFYWRFHFMAWR